MPVGSLISGMIGQQGSQAGGDMAWNAAQQANNQNNAEAVRGRNALSPWSGAGITALGKITRMLGLGDLTPVDNDTAFTGGAYKLVANPNAQEEERNAFRTSPGYDFRIDEGVKARDRGAAARGMTFSGAQSKALEQYGQDAASEEYDNHFNRLMGVSTGGREATTSGNSTSAALVNSGSNALYQGGLQRGSAYERGANSLASGINKGTQNALFLGTLASGGFGSKGGGSSYNLASDYARTAGDWDLRGY